MNIKSLYKTLALVATLFITSMMAGCQSAYYSAMEKVGVHKRDILVDRVEEARDAHATTQAEFQTAYERLVKLTSFDGGELEKVYNQLNNDFEDSEAAAKDVAKKIDSVEDVAQDLFEEWETELDQYSNPKLRRSSEQKLKETQRRFKQLLTSMRRAEAKMSPILATLQDNVLYLKHNLNASAVAAIKGEFESLKSDISRLITDMNKAIKESDEFISALKN
jgi:septation ring formation regulator EzrA